MISRPKSTDFLFSTSNYLKTLFNNKVKNSLVLMDDEGIIIAINPAFTNSFGYEPANIIGKNGSNIIYRRRSKEWLTATGIIYCFE